MGGFNYFGTIPLMWQIMDKNPHLHAYEITTDNQERKI